ncbi:MAG: hypothetical protein AB7E49_00565 [Campylobacterales bacterium]
MINKLIRDEAFIQMMADHAADTVDFLIEAQTPFGILCNLSEVDFDPPLPPELQKQLKPLTLFVLSGYTLESAGLDEEMLWVVFDAGFGEENFGSTVSVPTDAILQVIVDETVIFINLAASVPAPKSKTRTPPAQGGEATLERSLQGFLGNPENDKFFKR